MFWVAIVGVAAVVLGAVALSRVRRTGQRGQGLAIGGLVLGIVSVLAFGALLIGIVAGDGLARPISQARTGECLDLSINSDGEVKAFDRRRCDQAHRFEVVGTVTSPATRGDPYPGAAALESLGQDGCLPLFAAYVGIDFDDSELMMRPLIPISSSWAAGDRRVTCLVESGDGLRMSESVLNSGR